MAGPFSKERDVLFSNYVKLTNVRDVDYLLPYFVAAGIIHIDELMEIKAVPTTSQRVTMLLDNLSGIG